MARAVRSITTARLWGAEPGENLAGVDVDDSVTGWLDVAMPGDVRATLVAAGELVDPDSDPTDAAGEWVDDKEWWYRFDLPAVTDRAPDETVVLRFGGIDTFATVFVDGVERATSTNMFRSLEIDVTAEATAPGRHVVAVRIDRPWARIGLTSPAEFDDRRSAENPRTRIRKAQFGYGWDFAHDCPSLGIWRPVTVERRPVAWIESVRFQTLRIDGTAAVVAIDAFVGGARPDANARAAFALVDPSGHEVVRADAVVADGVARAVAVVENPQLWWPHTHGEPALHELGTDLYVSDAFVDGDVRTIGIRTVALDESPVADEVGRRHFRFVVNGQTIFSKGANWVPASMAPGTVTAAAYRPLLELARDAEMNMVRVWGGGVYEHDAFYEICDELGVLVWQEFMFACAPPPDDDQAWLDDIRVEATEQVRRLRSHPCLALWCGNNEIEAIAVIGDAALTHSPGARIFNEVLPQVVAAEDGVLGYIPTSPMMSNGSEQADRHNWDVWHALAARMAAQLPLGAELATSGDDMAAEQYLDDPTSFASEFGLRSFPARATLARWIDDADLQIDHPQLRLRDRDTTGPVDKVVLSTQRTIGDAHTLDELVDFSQFTQAEGLKLGCEHYRRRWPNCSGTLIWQLNDCWPAPTWSLVDYAGRAKGAWYYAARFYAPVLASFVAEEDGGASLWLVNDTASPVDDVLTVRLHAFASGDVWSRDLDVAVPAWSSRCVATFDAADVQAGPDRVLVVQARSELVPVNRLFFTQPRDLVRAAPKLDVTYEPRSDGRVAVTMTADAYTLFAHVLAEDPRVRFSDNYFDIEAGATRTVTSTVPVSIDQLSVRWL